MNELISLHERLKKTKRSARQCRAQVTVITALIVMALPVVGCHEKVSPGTAEVKRVPVTGVTVVELKPSQIDDYYETSGTVKAKNVAVIASKIMGSVTSVYVRDGEQVRKGQLLLTIDNLDIAQKVRAAHNAAESARQQRQLAEVTFERYKKLYEEKALSRQELDQIETQKNVAESEYDRAKAMLMEAQEVLGYTRVRAPFDGVVTNKKIDDGSMAMPGMHLLTVEDTSSFLVEAAVDEKFSARLKPGAPVTIVIDALGRDIKSKVSEVVPSIDPSTRTFIIKIALSDSGQKTGQKIGLKTGLYAKVKISAGTREALAVPASAIVEKGQLTGVYAVDQKGVVTYRLARIGKHFDGNVEILSGLNPGDRIIVSGTDKAVDGGIINGFRAGAQPK